MANRNYVKGCRKERRIVNMAKSCGLISFRSAGSHSPIDVVIIDKKNRLVRFIQCKPESMSENAKNKLRDAQFDLKDNYTVSFEVV